MSFKTKRWPRVVFLLMCFICEVQFTKKIRTKCNRNFLRVLELELINDQLQYRKKNVHLPKKLLKRILQQSSE